MRGARSLRVRVGRAIVPWALPALAGFALAPAALGCKTGTSDPLPSAATAADGGAPPHAVALAPAWSTDHEGLPRTCEGAVSHFVAAMQPALRAELLATPREGLAALHDSLGTSIANALGLWDDNPQLLASCASERPAIPAEPNAVSQRIIERAWERLRAAAPPPAPSN